MMTGTGMENSLPVEKKPMMGASFGNSNRNTPCVMTHRLTPVISMPEANVVSSGGISMYAIKKPFNAPNRIARQKDDVKAKPYP